MNRMASLLSAATLLLVALPATAGTRGEIREGGEGWIEKIDQVIEVESGGVLVVRADRGGIEVETWKKRGVRIVVEKEADVFTEEEARRVFEDYTIDVKRDGNDVKVIARSGSRRRTRSLNVALRVSVPRVYSVDVETDGGGIDIDDLEGNATARTGGGGIDIGQITNGSVSAHTRGGGISIDGIENGNGVAVTSGGGIDVGNVTGDLSAKTNGGGIDIGGVGGNLTAETNGGSIAIESGGAAVVAKTGGGGISIEGSKGPVSAKTGGGGITIDGAQAEITARTGGGGITIDGSGGPVVVRTGGGGITIEGAGGYIEANTGGGGITAELAIDDPAVDTHCDLETGGGDITIYLPAGLQATIDAEVRLQRPKRDYEITSEFALKIEGDPDEDRRLTARGSLNGGGDLIRLRTTNSSIHIKRR